MFTPTALVLSVIASIAAVTAPAAGTPPPSDFTVAFVGDTGPRSAVLFKKMKEWGVNMIVHAGDFSYNNNKNIIFDLINKNLDPTCPIVAAFGNHDIGKYAALTGIGYNKGWVSDYATRLRKASADAGVTCHGAAGEMEKCFHKGIVIVNLAYGLDLDWGRTRYWGGNVRSTHTPEKYVEFIDKSFSQHPTAYWRVCNFHVPQKGYTVVGNAGKVTLTSAIMEACQRNGAIVANGHHHVYSRTPPMDFYKDAIVANGHHPGFSRTPPMDSYKDFERGKSVRADSNGAPTIDLYHLTPGHSIQWVSGLGQYRDPISITASKRFRKVLVHEKEYSKIRNPPDHVRPTDIGAVICKFNPTSVGTGPNDGYSARLAICDFRDVKGVERDRFVLFSHVGGSGLAAMSALPAVHNAEITGAH